MAVCPIEATTPDINSLCADESSANHGDCDYFSCKFCTHRRYKSKGALSKHVKLQHREQYEQENGKIQCELCSEK